MSQESRFDLNVYELLLVQKILLILFDDLNKSKPSYSEMAKVLDVHVQTVKKLFNLGHHGNFPTFNSGVLDAIVGQLGIEKKKTWHSFRSNYQPKSLKNNSQGYIPIAHLSDLSDSRKRQVVEDVKTTLSKIFPDKDVTAIQFDLAKPEEKQIESVKLEIFFLNTTWYMYFALNEFKSPKIVRSIIRIGDSPNKAETEAIRRYGSNDFEGRVEFDKNESFLIFNLKAKGTNERWAHIKADVNTASRPPILMGQYQNIGIGGISMHFSNIVMEYLEPERAESAYPNFFDATSPDFFEVPVPIQKYLHDVKFNVAEPPERIFSLDSLNTYVKSEEFREKCKPSYVRLRRDYVAFIGHPRRALSNDRRKEYDSVFNDLKDYLATQNFQTFMEPLRNLKTELPPLFSPEFHLQTVQDCDLFVLIYFDEVVSNALSELAWAYQAGKHIFILTSKGKILPSIYKNGNRIDIKEFDDMQKAAEYFKQVFPFYAEPRFAGFNNSE